jgi:hypothetical protein
MVDGWKPAVVAIAALAASGGLGWVRTLSADQISRDAGTGVEGHVISALNDCIQQRFEEINDRFGVARFVRIGETPHRFQPESVAEMGSVRALEQARLQVVLYVAGTRVLRPTPTLPLVGNAHALAIIKGPVRVTPGAIDQVPPPSPAQLWEEGRRAMHAFLTREAHEFTQPGWTFSARPVRASGPACLECHRNRGADLTTGPDGPVKLGDALGVVMYGYRPTR